ncbi:hypothetical protein FA13DRAFT_1290815 [Coprinellus micaceus]|uniref:Uncharacterized protein n=1 Tax=Coprinellus micaceus TaxID=71717 RepID=A0A4Y7R6T7_COPMI|nr:hypothetical protein FA13DRAFT_1290815 [Coprinellus micaceus]
MEQGNESTKGSCGAWVSVPVQQVNGSYCVSLTLPNVSSTDPFILRMHDDANPDIVSPSFFIHPASPSNNTPSSVGDVLSSAGAPGLSFQLHRQSNLANDPLVVLMPSDAPHVPARNETFQVPDILPTPPLCLSPSPSSPSSSSVGALVTFVVIWVRQRRNGQLKKLYLTEHPMIYPRRPVPKKSGPQMRTWRMRCRRWRTSDFRTEQVFIKHPG